jgi:hypothetical protein
MKFGKRSGSDDAGAPGASVVGSFASPPDPPLPPPPGAPPMPERPPPVAEHEVPGVGDPGAVPPVEELPVVHAEPVVEGEAYELTADEPPETLTVHQHEPAPRPAPAVLAEQPVSVVTPGPGPAPVTTLGNSGAAFASGHAAGPPPSWQEPMQELAAERPELVVAAAFAGGLLAAMILRRLGN